MAHRLQKHRLGFIVIKEIIYRLRAGSLFWWIWLLIERRNDSEMPGWILLVVEVCEPDTFVQRHGLGSYKMLHVQEMTGK